MGEYKREFDIIATGKDDRGKKWAKIVEVDKRGKRSFSYLRGYQVEMLGIKTGDPDLAAIAKAKRNLIQASNKQTAKNRAQNFRKVEK